MCENGRAFLFARAPYAFLHPPLQLSSNSSKTSGTTPTPQTLDAPELLRYRSNLLGSDLRLTNFGGGNTSSKLETVDPVDGQKKLVLWVKGSGGDLGSIKRSGFATLYLDKLLALEKQYRGVDEEDAMVELYPLVTFGNNPTAASIDTPLHGFLPFPHVDHLHPDWAIALAASANGKQRMEEFNAEFGHKLAWLPWQRPGFELGMMLRKIVAAKLPAATASSSAATASSPGATPSASATSTPSPSSTRSASSSSATPHAPSYKRFGGARVSTREDRKQIAAKIMPRLRGAVSAEAALHRHLHRLAAGPRVRQLHRGRSSSRTSAPAAPTTSSAPRSARSSSNWDPSSDPAQLPALFDSALETYRAEYADYYTKHAEPNSPEQRDASPTVVLIPGVGMFSFGKNKAESRITGEFYTNAIGVMQGAGALG